MSKKAPTKRGPGRPRSPTSLRAVGISHLYVRRDVGDALAAAAADLGYSRTALISILPGLLESDRIRARAVALLDTRSTDE